MMTTPLIPQQSKTLGVISMRRIGLAILIFSAASQVGLLLHLVTRLSSWFDISPDIYDFLYELILLLWPAWPIAVMEVNTGRFIAVVAAAGANILPFALVGAIVGALGSRKIALLAVFICVSFAVVWVSVWASGDLAGINVASLIVALLLYASLFWGVDRLMRATRVA